MDSSRIFVRGLPPKFTEADVRKHFSKFPVTDVKFFPARRIGYVGYKTPEDASKAIKYFNKSFIRMSKIFVEAAKPIADHSLHKSRGQQKEETAALRHNELSLSAKDNNLKRKRDETEHDPKLKEFLEVMQPPSKLKAWANDETQLGSLGAQTLEAAETVVIPEGESDDEYQELSKKPKATPRKPSMETQSAVPPEPQPSQDESEDFGHVASGHMEEGDSIPLQGPVSDADWLRSRTNRVLDLVEDDEPPSGEVEIVDREDHVEVVEQDTAKPSAFVEDKREETAAASEPSEADKIRQTGRLFLRNLHYDVTEDDLRTHFSKYGSLEEVHVPTQKIDGKGKGFAFIQFENHDHAVTAFHENDGTIFQGRLLHIISGKAKRDNTLDEFAISKLPLKKQKEVLRKKNAASGTFNWNSLYLNTDAVMSAVAQRTGVSKSELLDPTSSDAAVKQAQAETHIIAETKNYFASHGVDLESFKRSSKGDTAILVKNIPHAATPADIRDLFKEHGTLQKFLMPPAGLTAIIEFANAAQAKSAFAALSYRKMKDSILYLEKAPKDLFKEGLVPETQPLSSEKPSAKLSAKDLLEEDEQDTSNTATLHVRNLNFSTTTQKLTEAFSPLAGFRSAIVRTKTDPKRGVLSMGYGFVEFGSAQEASAALRAMNGSTLEGHSLKIQASHKGADAAEERRKDDAAKKVAGTKILIKNLPFEATKKDVRALFAPYGSLRSVRVPKKFDSTSRGFGFAEYSTKREAANAMKALGNTHLLGRRLVLTFAETEAGDAELELEKMQKKVGAQANKVALQQLTSGGRKKFNVTGNDDLDE